VKVVGKTQEPEKRGFWLYYRTSKSSYINNECACTDNLHSKQRTSPIYPQYRESQFVANRKTWSRSDTYGAVKFPEIPLEMGVEYASV